MNTSTTCLRSRNWSYQTRLLRATKPTCLATDWSKTGIGFWKHCTCPGTNLLCCHTGWKITLVGSCFTHPAESRYAPVEGEVLAVADALDKSRHSVLGTLRGPHHRCGPQVSPQAIRRQVLEDISNSRPKRRPCATDSVWSTYWEQKTEPLTQSPATPLVTSTPRRCTYWMTSPTSAMPYIHFSSTSPHLHRWHIAC